MQFGLIEEKDLNEIIEIENKSFSQPWSYNSFLDSINSSNYIGLKAFHCNKIKAYCLFHLMYDECEIVTVACDPLSRQQGITGALLDYSFSLLKEKNYRLCSLEVRTGNKAAIALYEKQGFKKCGLRKNFYSLPDEDGYIMLKEI